MNPSKISQRWFALIIAITVSFFLPFAASAHEITPLTASPEPGAILQQSPDQVRLTFEEEIAEAGSTLQVFDAQGKQVDLGGGGVDLNDAQHTALVVGLPQLSEGAYLVKWQVTLADGDASHGEYYFGIGNVTLPQAPSAAPETEPEPETQAGSPIAIWAALVGAVMLIAAFLINRIRKTRPNQ